MKKRKYVVHYPSTIEKHTWTLKELDDSGTYRRANEALQKAGLPQKTRIHFCVLPEEALVTIILPDGCAYTGFAIKNEKDDINTELAALIAANRALAVRKRHYPNGGGVVFMKRESTFAEHPVMSALLNEHLLRADVRVEPFGRKTYMIETHGRR